MKLFKSLISVLFSATLLLSATNSFAIDKIHFLIGGGAGGGWDGTARGTGEALTKAGFLKSASFENMSGGGGGKADSAQAGGRESEKLSEAISIVPSLLNKG